MTEISSTNRNSSVKNPAPHRGFSSKAREILIEPTSKLFSNSIRHSSEHELLASRTLPPQQQIQQQSKLERTDSSQTNGSQKSHSSTQSYPEMTEEFDSLEDLPKKCGKGKAKKMLGDIGKTRSAGDLLKHSSAKKQPATLIRTFQQLNIMRLPSVDSVNSDHSKSLTRLNQINDPIFDDLTTSRQKAYEMK
uniref:Uncharacterized protein n=1 Tax=Panagrolaimus sp. ES5 TaxID=591445 RepID=A0AC34G8P9_9BILA